MIKPIIEQLTYMQDVAICDYDALVDSMEMEKVYHLIDRRSSMSYKIAKFKSGQVMMCQDLMLTDYLCTPEDTDMTEGSFQVPAGTDGAYPSNSVADTIAVRKTNETCYYSWSAATAGAKPEIGQYDTSIMPKGWGLPSAEDYLEFVKAYSTTDSVNISPVPGITRYGYWEGNNINNHGSAAYYWSSTVKTKDSPEFFICAMNNPYVRAQTAVGNGFQLRGILRKPEAGEGLE